MTEFSTKRVVAIAAVAGALVGGAVAGGVAVTATSRNSDSPAGSTGARSAVATAAVVRTTLTNTVQVGGSIGYQGSFTVAVPAGTSAQQIAQAQQAVTEDQQTLSADQQARSGASGGDNQAKVVSDKSRLQGDEAYLASLRATAANPGTTYTYLPLVGATVKENQRVYSLNDEEVPLLYGAIAAYRAFYVGMSDGADVGELTHDLISLGFGAGLSESNYYSPATATAVEHWQRKLGLPQTGEILLGGVVFEPGPIRVTSVTPSVGQSVGGGGGGAGGGGGGGTVLSATSTTPIVTVDLDVSDEYLVKPGDAVSIVLPDGTSTVGGRIETVGTVATCGGGGGIGTASGGPSGGGSSPCSSAGSGSNSAPTVTLTITMDSTPRLATLDQAPVNVNITTERAANILAAPVNALLALAGGGFGVDVVSGNTSHLVGVSTGLYDSTLVQISGTGIKAGALVQVPAS
jgi:peptidoglycan hydrolase-like protein with peptidoglycan-binding domain